MVVERGRASRRRHPFRPPSRRWPLRTSARPFPTWLDSAHGLGRTRRATTEPLDGALPPLDRRARRGRRGREFASSVAGRRQASPPRRVFRLRRASGGGDRASP